MHLILHAGAQKTGTTAIQQALWTARDDLAAAGLGYVGEGPNHGPALYSLLSHRRERFPFNLQRGLDRPATLARHNAASRKRLAAALSAPGPSCRLISGEALCRLELEELKALRAFLSPFASSFSVILYLRHPLAWIASMAQQRLKTGATFEQIAAQPPRPAHRTWIERFEAVFGRVDVRLYGRDTDQSWDAATDMLDALGVPGVRVSPGRQNPTMSVRAAEAIEALNRLVPFVGSDERYNPARARGTVRHLLALGGPQVHLLPALTCPEEDALAEDIAWVAERTGIVLDPNVGCGGAVPERNCPRAEEVALTVNDVTLKWERALRDKERLKARLNRIATTEPAERTL